MVFSHWAPTGHCTGHRPGTDRALTGHRLGRLVSTKLNKKLLPLYWLLLVTCLHSDFVANSFAKAATRNRAKRSAMSSFVSASFSFIL